MNINIGIKTKDTLFLFKRKIHRYEDCSFTIDSEYSNMSSYLGLLKRPICGWRSYLPSLSIEFVDKDIYVLEFTWLNIDFMVENRAWFGKKTLLSDEEFKECINYIQ